MNEIIACKFNLIYLFMSRHEVHSAERGLIKIGNTERSTRNWSRRIHRVTDRGGSTRRAAGLQPSLKNVRQKFPPNGQTLDLVTKISQHNHFRFFRHHFGSTFPRNPTKPMFRCMSTTPLMRWRFQHTCRWIWRFRGCHPHSPKRKKPNHWLQKTWWYIHLSETLFDILTMNF